ncbi:MAG: hypothetical protein V8T85_00795 [Blautia faecicola]
MRYGKKMNRQLHKGWNARISRHHTCNIMMEITSHIPNRIPEVFVKAAEFLGLPAEKCMVVKDAEAGINAAIAGHMDSGAIGDATGCGKATYNLTSFRDLWKAVEE